MRLLSLLLLSGPLFLAAGCASDPYNIPDPGPAEAQAEPDDGRYSVTYRGAPTASPQRVRDLALLRAATITIQKGGTWFEIVTDYSRVENSRLSSFELDPFREAGEARNNCGVLGCPSTTRPDEILGQRDIDPDEIKRTNIIQSFEIIVNTGERPFGKQNTYDAIEVSDEMRTRYGAAENR